MTWPLDCIRQHELLADHTSFRIGGPAEWFAEPSSLEELLGVLRGAVLRDLPVSVVGGGTNTLAADRGVRGLTLHLGGGFRRLSEIGDPEAPIVRLACGGALLTQRLVSLGARHGWGQLDALAGLPGQLGGAVTMNAQNIGRFVQQVTVVAFHGAVTQLSREALHFGYRYTAREPGIIVDVIMEFPRVSPEEASEGIRRALRARNETQEVRLPSAGCAFKNPPGARAGQLIDQAGLKGARIGDAQVSRRHANFIVNLGHATCADVLSLMEHIQRRVQRHFRISLEPEVRVLGERV